MNEALRDWVANVRRHLLHHRHRRGPASLSGDGARFPVGDRPGGARADAASAKAGCPTRWSPASAAARTPWACSIPFLDERAVAIYGVEAGGHGLEIGNGHAASHDRRRARRAARQSHLSSAGRRTARSSKAHSISAGLDYPGVGPEHSWLRDTGRVKYVSVDRQGGARRLPALRRGWRASFRRWSRRTRSLT